jgi:hypothetical protein
MGKLQANSSLVKSNKILIKKQNLGGGRIISNSYDPDARNYISAVQQADGQLLEIQVKIAINKFVVGCKSDGIWSAIKSSCILAGARTLNGALVSLNRLAPAPTNFGFISSDYSRTIGLKGDGINKYLFTNRNNDADPQNSKHLSVYCTSSNTKNQSRNLIGTGAVTGGSFISSNAPNNVFRINSSSTGIPSTVPLLGLVGASRSSPSSFSYRFNQNSGQIGDASTTPSNDSIRVFTNPLVTSVADARISFYSIGESINLALLESRIASLMSDLSSVIV